MKIIVKCEQCGNFVQVTPETLGNVAYFSRELRENGFTIYHTLIDAELQDTTVSDADDVETTLKEIRIDCDHCGAYICLDF